MYVRHLEVNARQLLARGRHGPTVLLWPWRRAVAECVWTSSDEQCGGPTLELAPRVSPTQTYHQEGDRKQVESRGKIRKLVANLRHPIATGVGCGGTRAARAFHFHDLALVYLLHFLTTFCGYFTAIKLLSGSRQAFAARRPEFQHLLRKGCIGNTLTFTLRRRKPVKSTSQRDPSDAQVYRY